MENTNVERLNTLWEQLQPGYTIYAYGKDEPFTIANKIENYDVKGFITTSSWWIPINQVNSGRSKNPNANHVGGRRRNRKSKRKARSRYSRRN